MPIYEYACDSCGHRFDRLQSFRDDPVRVCPECGEASCRRLISAPGIVFKGSGWYIKDSKTGGRSRPGSSRRDDDGGKKDGEKGTASKSETGSKGESSADSGSSGASSSSSGSSGGSGSTKADA